MKKIFTLLTGTFVLCFGTLAPAQTQQAQPQPQSLPDRAPSQPQQARRPDGFTRQHTALNQATNTLRQGAGGSNRAPDRFDRTLLDRRLGQLRDTVGGAGRGFVPPPQTNQPQDFAGGGQFGGGGFGGGGEFGGGGGIVDPALAGLAGDSYSSGGYSGMGYGTLPAGQLHGTADMIRGIGEANRNTATATLLNEKAEEQSIQNWFDSVTAYFKAREANREFRRREQLPISSQEDRVRYSQARLPRRLTDGQLNRDIGDIRWPAVLMAPEFAEHRERLEELFYNRSYYNSGLASTNFVEVKAETERMLATLQNFVEVTEPQSYLHAKNFIQGLSYEARFVAGPEGLARS
jgi:hypothetical protein